MSDEQGEAPEGRTEDGSLESFFDLSIDPSFELNDHGHFVRVNRAWRAVLGHDPDRLVGQSFMSLVHEEDRPEIEVRLTEREARCEVRLRCVEGEPRRVFVRIASDGSRTRGVVRETSAYDERDFMRVVLASTSAAIVVLDADGTVIAFNRAAERMSGYHASEVVGQRLWEAGLTAEDDASRYVEWLAKVAAQDFPFTYELDWYGRDGAAVRLEWCVTGLLDDQGRVTHLVGVGEDISERRRIETRVEHGRRMDAVGRLAAVVAHDFSNTLSVVLNSCQFALDAMGDHTEAYDDVRTAHDAAVRAAALTRQLMLFGRHDPATPERLDVRQMLRDLAPSLRRLVGEGVELEMRLDDEVEVVEIARTHLEQVLVSLARNAKDAMGGQGTLTVRAHLRVQSVAAEGSGAERWVAIELVDTGPGMSAAVLERACEPFFSTKEGGGHRGLGLSIVYGLVTQAGGLFFLESGASGGAVATVCLPVALGSFAGPPPAAAAEQYGRRLGERVLVVEDERPVRRAVARLLRRAGFEALEASSGEEALARIAREGDVDIVLSDVVMPGLSGTEMAALLAESNPSIPVVYMSGYAADHLRKHGVEEARFLHKPFKEAELVRLLRRALDGDSDG